MKEEDIIGMTGEELSRLKVIVEVMAKRITGKYRSIMDWIFQTST